MTALELLNIVAHHAQQYRKGVADSLQRNKHLHEYRAKTVSQELVDAVLVDFINNLAAERYGIDYALSTSDFEKLEKKPRAQMK